MTIPHARRRNLSVRLTTAERAEARALVARLGLRTLGELLRLALSAEGRRLLASLDR